MTAETPYTPAYAPITIETERALLVRLNYLAGRNPRTMQDDRCLFCGLHRGDPLLCDACDQRRLRLADKFPDVPALKPFAEIEAAQRDQEPVDYPKQPTIDVHRGTRDEWLPYVEQEDE